MADHNDLGKTGEEKAVAYLEGEGYEILERNWFLKHKEIDIVCTDGKMIVVVEVKTRHRGEEHPDELLDYKKRRNLLTAGDAYIRKNKICKELRFDLILVIGENYEIQHIKEVIKVFDE